MLFIVLLAMVAAFLALRLYSVLGKRTGHEQPLPRAADDRVPAPAPQRVIDITPGPRENSPQAFDEQAERCVRALIAADPSFDVAQFLDGAKSAYKMILEAYWAGDRATLEWLVEAEVRTAFESAIDARAAAGETLENRLVSIERSFITDAHVEGGRASVSVRFDADIAAVTRDSDGAVISGSMNDAVQSRDIWTFSKTLRSSDPDWKLSDTDEA